jgi:hypothetical protein
MGSLTDKKKAIEKDTRWTPLLPGSWCPSISFRLCPRHVYSFKCFFAAICVLRSVSAHAAALLHTCADRRHAVFHLCSALIDFLLLSLQQIRFWTFAISRGAAALFRLLNRERVTGVECAWVAWRTREDLKLSFSSFGLVEALCVSVQDLQRCSDSTRTSSLSFFLLPLRSVNLVRGSGQWRLWYRYILFVSLIVVEIRSLRLLTCSFSLLEIQGSAVCFWICCRVVAVLGFDMMYIVGRRWDEFLAS